MEEFINLLSEQSKKRFLKKYNSDPVNKQNFINELNIGIFFSRAGFEIEYDRAFDDKTPDWTIFIKKEPICIIEVLTLHQIKEDADKQDLINSLSNHFNNIPGNFIIECEIRDNSKIYKAIREVEYIARDVKNWLLSGHENPLVLDNYNITFDFTNIKSPKDNFEFIYYSSINHDPVRFEDKVINKIIKYQQVVHIHKIPLIIAVVSETLNMIDDIDLKKLLFGTEIDDRRFGKNFSLIYSLKDGIFSKYSEILNGFIWTSYEREIKEIFLYLNPSNSNGLKEKLLSKDLIKIMPRL
jgi:hypothetical protein